VTSIEPLAPYVPEEATETTLSLAPRRPISDPVRITLIDNGKPRTVELLRNVVDQLRPPLPVAEVTVYFKGAASRIIDENEAADLARSSDLVITGLGDCGACSANSLADALRMEALGIPSTVVITSPFVGHITSWAVTMGLPGYHFSVVPTRCPHEPPRSW
jgi:hypothetical protein